MQILGKRPLVDPIQEVWSMVKINGAACDAAGKTVAEYLEGTDYDIRRIAVERNGEIVPKAQYENVKIEDGDTLEVVSFVGGG